MLLDARSLGRDETIESDLCIVGAGVAGITLARELADAKVKICLIESGGIRPDKPTQALHWGENVGIPYYPLDTCRARFFGGTSHYWHIPLPEKGLGVRLRPMDPIDFETRDWVPHSGWPFGKSHLESYYLRAQEICQIGAYNYDPEYWQDPAHGVKFAFKGDRVGTTIFQFAEREHFYGQYGDEISQKDHIRILLHANAVDIQTPGPNQPVTRIEVKCLERNRVYVNAKWFVLATGGIETPRLLLLANKTNPNGLGNENDLVGRFFMEHPHLWSGRYIPSNLAASNATGLYHIHRAKGTAILAKLALTEKVVREEKLLNWCTSIHADYMLSHRLYMMQNSAGVVAFRSLRSKKERLKSNHSLSDAMIEAVRNWEDIVQASVRRVKGGFERDFNRSKHIAVYRLNHMAEQAPNPDSRVLLGEERDTFGQRRCQLDWQLTDLDTRTITRAQEIVSEELQKVGLGHLQIETDAHTVPPKIHGGYHHMGTTRMHTDPKQGVVNPDCQVYGVPNLFIAGASVFPTVGFANPVLTTLALVFRLADHLRTLFKNGPA
ncbi:MAG: GMC family oxidoreductase [Desulfobacteraceae bacterium]|jgi:choline dehydrogenase-like flavoprotein